MNTVTVTLLMEPVYVPQAWLVQRLVVLVTTLVRTLSLLQFKSALEVPRVS